MDQNLKSEMLPEHQLMLAKLANTSFVTVEMLVM